MTTDLIQTILARRSIRKYTPEPVSQEDIRPLLRAAMSTRSASNCKPWQFIVVTERETLDALAEAHLHGNMLFEAPLGIPLRGDLTEMERYWVQDCSAATENLLLEAAALGLGAVWLDVYPREEDVAKVCRILAIPKCVTPLNVVSIGHPAEEKRSRTQYNEACVHRGRW